jgi:hypothetical protein
MLLLVSVNVMTYREPATRHPQPRFVEPMSAGYITTDPTTGLRTLAQGKYSRVEIPFIMVSRSRDTYNQIRTLLGSLPELDSNFFQQNAVVAAFLGQRFTGGESVEIVFDNKVRIMERAAAGANVTQQLTSPFAVVAIPVERQNPLVIEPDDIWMRAVTSYQATQTRDTAPIGESKRDRSVNFTGRIDVIRYESVATLFFHPISQEKQLNNLLNGALTVQVAQDGSFSASGSLTEFSGRQQHIAGKFRDNNTRLSIEISPSNADGLSNSEFRYLIEACIQQASH